MEARTEMAASKERSSAGRARGGTKVSSTRAMRAKYSSWYSFTTGPGAPVDVIHRVALAVLARAHEPDGVAGARGQRDPPGLVAPAGRRAEARQRVEARVDEQDLLAAGGRAGGGQGQGVGRAQR